MLTDPTGAVHNLAEPRVWMGIRIGVVFTLDPNAPADIRGGGDTAAASEQGESGASGGRDAADPGVKEWEVWGVEGGGIGDSLLLPWPRTGLEGEGSNV